jgi:DNA-directed RNA polymerase subunit RPC12/RpoP
VKTLPSTSPVGRLRLERVGPVLRYLVADGPDGPFVTIEELDLGTAELRYVRVEGDAGRSQTGLDARLVEFSVRAAGLPGLPDDRAGAGGLLAGRGWLAAGVFLLLLVAAIGGCLVVRRGGRPPASDTAGKAAAAAPPIAFGCPRCGNALKGKAEQAGKKGKCPRCGNRVVVPRPSEAIQPGGATA